MQKMKNLPISTIRERITAQGDTAASTASDPPIGQSIDRGDAMTRIEQAEGHYADSCAQFRR